MLTVSILHSLSHIISGFFWTGIFRRAQISNFTSCKHVQLMLCFCLFFYFSSFFLVLSLTLLMEILEFVYRMSFELSVIANWAKKKKNLHFSVLMSFRNCEWINCTKYTLFSRTFSFKKNRYRNNLFFLFSSHRDKNFIKSVYLPFVMSLRFFLEKSVKNDLLAATINVLLWWKMVSNKQWNALLFLGVRCPETNKQLSRVNAGTGKKME